MLFYSCLCNSECYTSIKKFYFFNNLCIVWNFLRHANKQCIFQIFIPAPINISKFIFADNSFKSIQLLVTIIIPIFLIPGRINFIVKKIINIGLIIHIGHDNLAILILNLTYFFKNFLIPILPKIPILNRGMHIILMQIIDRIK